MNNRIFRVQYSEKNVIINNTNTIKIRLEKIKFWRMKYINIKFNFTLLREYIYIFLILKPPNILPPLNT